MKKLIFILIFFPAFLFSGIFEHLLNKDTQYLLKHNFKCSKNICSISKNKIFNNKIMDDSVKVVKTFLDHEKKVYKIEVELSIFEEKSEAFFDALKKNGHSSGKVEYKSYMLSDKYGSHPIVDITYRKRRNDYIKHLSKIYYETMKNYETSTN